MKRYATPKGKRINKWKFLNITLFNKREKERLNSEHLNTLTTMNTTNYTKTFKEFPFITTQSTFNTSIKKNKSKKKISRN